MIKPKHIYEKYKDQKYERYDDFQSKFLEDLNTLEYADISHPDIPKIRALLAEENSKL